MRTLPAVAAGYTTVVGDEIAFLGDVAAMEESLSEWLAGCESKTFVIYLDECAASAATAWQCLCPHVDLVHTSITSHKLAQGVKVCLVTCKKKL